jgi:hypothetical protein
LFDVLFNSGSPAQRSKALRKHHMIVETLRAHRPAVANEPHIEQKTTQKTGNNKEMVAPNTLALTWCLCFLAAYAMAQAGSEPCRASAAARSAQQLILPRRVAAAVIA